MASYSTGLINKLLGKSGTDTGADGLRGVFANCVIHLYSGVQPANADAAATGTLLGTVTKDGGAFTPGSATNGLNFGAPVGKILSKNGDTWKFTGLASGTIGYFRIVGNATDSGASSTSLPRIDGSVGVSSGELILNSLTTTVGVEGTVSVCNINWS